MAKRDVDEAPLPVRAAKQLHDWSGLLRRPSPAGRSANRHEAAIAPAQARILAALARDPVATPSGLAARLGVSRPTMTVAIRRLEELGFVDRDANGRDGRSANLGLTQRGRAAAARESDWPAVLAAAIGKLPPEDQAALERSLRKLREIVGA